MQKAFEATLPPVLGVTDRRATLFFVDIGVPMPLRAAWFVLLAFATTAVARLIDHLIAGPLAGTARDADRQPDARTSYVRIAERVVGTVVGVVAAYTITNVVRHRWSIAVAAVLIALLMV